MDHDDIDAEDRNGGDEKSSNNAVSVKLQDHVNAITNNNAVADVAHQPIYKEHAILMTPATTTMCCYVWILPPLMQKIETVVTMHCQMNCNHVNVALATGRQQMSEKERLTNKHRQVTRF